MTRKIWIIFGKILFWPIWPLLFIYLRRGERSRVLVVCGDEVLLVKSWLGPGRWELPGGGVHKGEQADQAASRELSEELGMDVDPSQLSKLSSQQSIPECGLDFSYTAFVLELRHKPKVRLQKSEITEFKWFSLSKLDDLQNASPNVSPVVASWSER